MAPAPSSGIPPMPSPPQPYQPGPFCFGLDQYICANLPEKIHLGGSPGSLMEKAVGGVDIPVQQFCLALTNVLCAVVVLVFLLTILGIAFAGLIF